MAGELQIVNFSVGSGDAALVIFPNGKTMLIDTGKEDPFNLVVLPFLQRNGIYHLDYLVASHGPGDPTEGRAVLETAGIIDSTTVEWDNKMFDYEDEFTIEEVNFFIYNVHAKDFHGSTDVN